MSAPALAPRAATTPPSEAPTTPPAPPPGATPSSSLGTPPSPEPARAAEQREPAPPETPAPSEAPPDRSTDDDLADILARLGAEGDQPRGDEAHDLAAPKLGDKLTDPRDLTRPSSASGIVVEVGAGLDFDPSFASYGKRALGAIIDTAVVTLAVVPGLIVSQLGGGTATALLGLAVSLLGFLAVVVLGARALAANGKWVGNRVAGTTVVDAINGSFIDAGRGALRMFGRHVISPIFLFGYLIAFADGQRRTFHDRLVGTVVTQRARETWTADDG